MGNDTLISFVNVDKPGSVVGENINKKAVESTDDDWIVNNTVIQLDWEAIKSEEDAYIYGVALHEFSHSLWLGDVYLEYENVTDRTTLMNVDN